MSQFQVREPARNNPTRNLSLLTIPQLAGGSPSSSASSSPRSSTETALPFPTPLPRSDFLAPDFSPSTYLSDLAPSRHQVLEDLRSDLRVRSQQLSRELLDLVNAHYADFLGLGGNLRGGREKVEQVRVGLMGFQREVEGVRESLVEKEAEIKALVDERRGIRTGMEKGRELLEWIGKIETLEGRLRVAGPGESVARQKTDDGSEDEDSDSDDDDDADEILSDEETNETTDAMLGKMSAASLTKLKKRIQDFRLIQQSASRIGIAHPFIVAQHSRLTRIRNTLLLDLSSCLRETGFGSSLKLEVVALYNHLDAAKEAVESIRALKGRR